MIAGGLSRSKVAAAILLPASLVQAAFIFLAHRPEHFIYSDMLFFSQVANRLQFDVATPDDLLKPIGYPLLVALSLALTGGLAALKLLHWVAATATLAFLWRSAASTFGERVGMLTLLAASGHFPFLLLGGFVLPETVFTALLAGLLYGLVRTGCLTRSSAAEAGLLGLVFGLAFWLKGNVALFGPLLVTWLALRAAIDPLRRLPDLALRLAAPAAAFCIGFVLLLGLHLAATGRWYGEARLSSPVGGLNFVEGKCDSQHNYDARGLSTLSPLAVQTGPIKVRHWNAPFTDDGFFWRAGFDCVADDPGIVVRSLRYVYFLAYGNRLWPATTTGDDALNSLHHVYYGAVMVPGLLLALGALASRPLRVSTAPYLLLVLTLLIGSWLFKSELRYRIPFDVVLLPLAIHGWDRATGRRLTRSPRLFAGVCAALAAVALATSAWVLTHPVTS